MYSGNLRTALPIELLPAAELEAVLLLVVAEPAAEGGRDAEPAGVACRLLGCRAGNISIEMDCKLAELGGGGIANELPV